MTVLRPGLCPSLTTEIVSKLAAKGIKRVLDFVCTDPEKITSLCEISYKTVISIRRVLLAQYSSFPINGLNLYEESLATLSILPTQCQALDNILASGVFTGEVTEIRGSTALGKTQFCINLAVNIADSLSQNVVFIDTACGFSAERTAQILTSRNVDLSRMTETLSRIRVSDCTSAHQLLDILTAIRTSLNALNDSFYASIKAVIVDSVPAVLLPYLKSVSYVEGQSLLTTLKKELNSLAKDFTIAVVITNDVNISSAPTENSPVIKTALGHSWSTVASTQIDLHSPNYLSELSSNSTKKTISGHLKLTVGKSPHAVENASLELSVSATGLYEIKK